MGDRSLMSDPLLRFAMEHEQALAALDRLERAAAALAAGDPPEPHVRTVREVQETLETAVRQHNDDEERALFPLIAAELPCASFQEEHVRLRELERRLERALAGPHPERDVPPVARTLADLLRDHIRREDEMLFPAARELLGGEGLERVASRLRAGAAGQEGPPPHRP
jgi:hemerythrin-like domain-containing protein